MKKSIIVIICAAFAWSIQACNNSSNQDMDNNQYDSLEQDTMTNPPIDTNRTLDNTIIDRDTM